MDEETIKPLMLLNNMDTHLGPMGELKDEEAVCSLQKIMKSSFDKLVYKCIIVNILAATNNENILVKFVEGEGWNLLNSWLKSAKENNNGPLLLELLKIHMKMPVSIPLLKTNDTAKVIKQLIKIEGGNSIQDEIQILAKRIVTNWMNMIHETKLKNESLNPTIAVKDKLLSIDNDDSQTSSSNSTEVNDENAMTQQFLPSVNKPGQKVRLKKTFKPFQAKFRATGLEEEIKPPSLKGHKTTVKRPTGEINALAKKIKQIDPYKSISSTTPFIEDISCNSNINTVQAKASHHIIESTGFMDALDVAANETTSARDKQRRLSGSLKPSSNAILPSSKKSNDHAQDVKFKTPINVLKLTLLQPNNPVKTPQLLLPFYKDHENDENMDDEPNENKLNKFQLLNQKDEDSSLKDTINQDMDVDDDKEIKIGTIFDPTIGTADENKSIGVKGILSSAGKTTAKDNKKIVKWREEADLTQIYYFELDESERAFVRADHSQFADMKRNELALEKRALQHAKKVTEWFPWKPPPLIDGLVPLLAEPGVNSHEKLAQSLRESRALQEIYFDVRSIPDAPKEADHDISANPEHGVASATCGVENMEIEKIELGALLTSPIVIPLEDVNNPDNVVDYRNYQIPITDENSKKIKKNFKLKANVNTPHSNQPAPETIAPGADVQTSALVTPNMINSNAPGFGTFLPGQQIMVPPPPPGTILPRPPYIAGQNSLSYPGNFPLPNAPGGMLPMPPINPMIVNSGLTPPPHPSGMVMMNMPPYRNGPNRLPPIYVQQQQMQGMMHQMQQSIQQFRMRYQPPNPPSGVGPVPTSLNPHSMGKSSHNRDQAFSDDRKSQINNISNHTHRPSRPQRPTSDLRPNFKKQICKHFASPSGCRFGKNCSFLHIKDDSHSSTTTSAQQT